MLKLARPRLFARSMPTTPVLSKAEVLARLTKQPFEAEAKDEEFSLDGLLESLSPTNRAAERRATAFTMAHKKALAALLGHLKRDEKELIEAAIGKGQWRGIHSQHQMHEKIAALHSQSPWMAPAATAVMKAMTRATSKGAAPFSMPPLLLVGKPGIGKSQWARALAQSFAVPSIEVDIGGAGGGLFALSGVERGWGSATPGRLVREMLASHVVNPLVILDEVDKAPTNVATSKGMGLPGTYEVLKSLIEPSTARSWVPGLPMGWPLRSETWSEPMTMASGNCCATACALASARRSANAPGASPGKGVSSTSGEWVVNGIFRRSTSSLR